MSAKLYIAYCEDNQSIVDGISQKLSKANFNFVPLSSKATQDDQGLTFLIAESKLPGILLLSDNFLKNEACLKNMLSFIQNSAVSENMQIIVTDGQYATGDVETSFDRVSNVIKYMNFWQEKYLEMRKQKRSISSTEEESFNNKLLGVKNISSEIGDFLRVARSKDFWTYDQLVFNNFEIFFKKFGSIGQHQSFSKLPGNAAASPKTISPTKPVTPVTPPVIAASTPPVPPTPKVEVRPEPEVSPVMEKPELAPEVKTINDDFSSQISKIVVEEKVANINQKTMNTVLGTNQQETTLHAKLKNSINQSKDEPVLYKKEVVLAEKDLEQEEQEIEEVLHEVKSLETQELLTQIDKDNLPDPDSRNELEAVYEEPEEVEEFNEVFTEEEEINLEVEDEIEEDVTEVEEVNVAEVEETDDEVEELDDDFDVMDGIEVDDEEFEEIEINNGDLNNIYPEEEVEEIEEELIIEDVTIEEEPVDLGAVVGTAWAFMTNGAHKKGINTFESILEDHPENIEIRYQYARALRDEVNDIEKAAFQFETIIKKDQNHFPSYKALAEISEQNNDFLLAKSYYEKVTYLNPEEPGVYYKLGLITAGFYAEKPKLAAKYLKKSINQNPDNEDAYYRLGLIQSEHLGKSKKALSNFLNTLKINPDHPFANYDLALLYHNTGDRENAAKYYEKAWSINSELKTPENDIAFHFEKPGEAANVPQVVVQQANTPQVENDKVILITGATSGIGKATAQKFAENGFRIILTGRRADRLEALKTDFETNYNSSVKTLHFDVRNIEEVKSMINGLDEEWRNIDVLINNAGLAKGFDPIHEADVDHWNTMIDTNIKGLLYLTRAVSPHMVERKSGHIINVCSTAGKEVYSNGNVYCATKHAVDSLTKSMRLDLYKHNIRVGQVSPAHVEETEFAFVRFEDEEKAKIYNDFQPLKSSDVADAIYYIVNAPAHVNVQDIVLMGKQQANSSNVDRSGRE